MPIRKYEKDDGCCSRSLLRNYLYIFNFFLLCGSLTVFGIGFWSYWTEQEFIKVLLDVKYPLTSYLLMGAGVIGVVASTFGCCGIARSDRCILLIYIFLLLAVFLLEVVAGSLAYIYREEAFQDLQMSLNNTFMESYGVEAKKTDAIDQMQQQFMCCGSNSFEDWNGSRWKEMIVKEEAEMKVPDSCCKTEGNGCGKRDHPSNIYYTGCIHKLSDTVRNHFGYHTIAGLGLCILQLIGVIFSTCLYSKLKDADVADL